MTAVYRRETSRYLRNVVKRLQPEAVVLYGSHATDSYGAGSDIDILVVSDRLPMNFLERLRILAELNRTTAPIEAVGYTRREFSGMLRKRHPTALDVLEEGKILYSRGFMRQMRRRFLKMKQELGLVKVQSGWDLRRTRTAG